MRVRLTLRQYRALSKALPEPFQTWFIEQGGDLSGNKMVDVDMIPDAWHDIERHLISDWEGRRMSAALLAAAARVVSEVRHHVTHPAFIGAGVVGSENVPLIGWLRADGTLSPLVENWDELSERFVYLWPTPHPEGNVQVTTWERMPVAGNILGRWRHYDEQVRRPT